LFIKVGRINLLPMLKFQTYRQTLSWVFVLAFLSVHGFSDKLHEFSHYLTDTPTDSTSYLALSSVEASGPAILSTNNIKPCGFADLLAALTRDSISGAKTFFVQLLETHQAYLFKLPSGWHSAFFYSANQSRAPPAANI
jgi:hypothetical protein